ncbi:MAG: 4-aminobutyrate aminotransferase [Lentisphaerae bacterium RIFOXYB12_FULL_65_16]|nr:MAG: 4-aminobutyrate aminotransferase [Lentisphaerae bacterium RIFOXYA12_64_32]OGV93461.1 MAG: 4-aminobutyrate aminotransferase [Lentisphaerae bacterium RIFOXYB12_FULL_65_16]
MAGHKYTLTPVDVPKVDTKYRRIVTRIPVPESLPLFEKLSKWEPVSMQGQPPIVWDRAVDCQVFDRWGNMWLDWSSCVLVSNIGHGRPEICDALRRALDKPLLATYVFPHEARAELCEMLAKLAPPGRDKVFLLSTGSEATENAIKLARTYGVRKHGRHKFVIVSFSGAFHGRTFGAQMAGGMDALKDWIVHPAPGFVQVPFPDGFRNEDTSFALFLKSLQRHGFGPEDVAGVITESYQGIGPNFLPDHYARELGAWCKKNDVVLIMDEVQAGFGRTGKMFCYEHYDLTPDLICCGKGISSSLPISAVIGRDDIMNLYAPGSMTSTHSASPLPVAAAVENLKILLRENLTQRAADLDKVLGPALDRIQKKYSANIGAAMHRGLVGGLLMVKPGTKDPDPDKALAINEKCLQKGLLMFAPVGFGGGCIKIAPPLTIPEDALKDGLSVLEESCAEVLGG